MTPDRIAAIGFFAADAEVCLEFSKEWSECQLLGCLLRVRHLDMDFPPVEQVIPKKGQPVGPPPWFDAHLLEGVRDIRRRGTGPFRRRGMRLQWGPSELDPIVVDLGEEAWTCVIMPMRDPDEC